MSIIFKKFNNNLIAVTIGDIEGIGIQILLKEWLSKKIKNVVLITNIKIFKNNIIFKNKNINLINSINLKNYNKKKLNILDLKTKNKYTNSLDSLKVAYQLTRDRKCIGVLTLPINKKKINKFVDKRFIDQTTFFSKMENVEDSNMMFIYNKKFFIPLTTHIELKNVYKYFKNKNKVVKKIESINYTLINDFKIKKPKLILAGINPHAGEDNMISKDENNYLRPIIKDLKKNNIDIDGPVSGDSIVNKSNIKIYDAFIFTFHDQGLIPFKIISNYKGVNFTSKLNIIRVSPSHGTAEKLVKSNTGSSDGILNSLKIIRQIYKNRK